MQLNITGPSGKVSSKVEVSEENFAKDFNEPLVHQVVTAYLAGGRAGTKAQKTRSQVRGGGAKPWRQKGTGKARAGTIRSPIWRGGGRTFAATPSSHAQKVNKKMHRGAMRAILSELVRQERLVIIDSFVIDKPKTKDLLSKLQQIGVTSGLIVTANWESNVFLSARNVSAFEVQTASNVNPVNLVKHSKVVMTVDALKKLEEVLA